jgi:CheY-like chemotaxis protein
VLNFGIAAYLTKPARSSALLGTIVGAIQKARAQGAKAVFNRPVPDATASAGVTVLRAPQPVPLAAAELREAQPRAGMPLDVLIAEDNEVNQLVFGQILGGLGLSYRIAGNGRTAVEMYRTLKPKLILMDVSMPEMNGYEATRAIRADEAGNGSHTPIIGVTAHALKGDREKCIEAGMDDYLSKPISPDKLGAKISAWLSEDAVAKAG